VTGPPVVLKTVLLILLGLEALRIATIHVYLNREWRWALAVFLILAFGICGLRATRRCCSSGGRSHRCGTPDRQP